MFVSSRAAGDVDEKTHEVEIAQIFTYDIVCTPGFAEAKLERVNESLGTATAKYLNESVSAQKAEKETTKNKFKVLTEGVSVSELEQEAPINEKCMELKNKPVKMKDLIKPLLEEDEDGGFKLPEADVTPDGDGSDNSDTEESKTDDTASKETPKKDTEKSEPTDEEKKKKRALILNITSEDVNGESSEEGTEDEEKAEKRADIISVEGQSDADIADDGNADNSKDLDSSEPVEDTDTDVDAPAAEEGSETTTAKAERIAAETEKDMEEFQDLLDNLEKKESIKESIINHYPFAISLSPENFAKFAALKPTQKKKCMKFIVEHNIFTIKDINEQVFTPLNAERRILKNWLRLADAKDIELYTQASLQEQDAIENMARYMVLETKQDVDEFWEKTGLRTREAQRLMNEEFVRRYKVQQKPIMKPVQESEHPLGYTMDHAALLEQMYENM